MRIAVLNAAFDPWDELRRHQTGLAAGATAAGACASFVGSLRDFNAGDAVRAMRLEHYPGMTDKYLQRIAVEAQQRWPILDVLILHRVGDLQPGHPIVLAAVWSAHRAAAFAACEYLVEELKSRAPFWKKEILAQGERWVEHNTPSR
ncbi:MAG: molybdenum cofactor biosynthesis protein MoaE [Gammaproteobacteria bacterium]